MFFPQFRARRIRGNEVFRRMVSETTLSVNDLVYPMFSAFGRGIKKEISSMPGIYQQSIEHIVAESKEVYSIGIPAVLLFGIPETKDAVGSDAYSETGIIQETIRAIKREVPGLAVITDVCMCEYTDHGHCGIIKDGDVDNDSTLELLAREALSHARAGADMVAPSDMMDGRVAAIREELDENGFDKIPIMSYAVKYASGYYGPFREAAESTPSSATAAATRWTRPTAWKRCARLLQTSKRAPTSSWSNRVCPILTSCATCAMNTTCRWLSTTSRGNTA